MRAPTRTRTTLWPLAAYARSPGSAAPSLRGGRTRPDWMCHLSVGARVMRALFLATLVTLALSNVAYIIVFPPWCFIELQRPEAMTRAFVRPREGAARRVSCVGESEEVNGCVPGFISCTRPSASCDSAHDHSRISCGF